MQFKKIFFLLRNVILVLGTLYVARLFQKPVEALPPPQPVTLYLSPEEIKFIRGGGQRPADESQSVPRGSRAQRNRPLPYNLNNRPTQPEGSRALTIQEQRARAQAAQEAQEEPKTETEEKKQGGNINDGGRGKNIQIGSGLGDSRDLTPFALRPFAGRETDPVGKPLKGESPSAQTKKLEQPSDRPTSVDYAEVKEPESEAAGSSSSG